MASASRAAPIRWIARGAASGGIATVAMSAVMYGAKRAGLMGTMPPEKITARLFRRLGRRHPGRRTQDVIATLLHVGFGAGAGALYSTLRSGLRVPGPSLATGILFGAAIWVVSYAGWVPALGIMPPPSRDRPGRPQSMLAAHLVFGAVLGSLMGRRADVRTGRRPLRRRSSPPG